jgi:hypothetical protein
MDIDEYTGKEQMIRISFPAQYPIFFIRQDHLFHNQPNPANPMTANNKDIMDRPERRY